VALAERCEGLISSDQVINVPEGHHFVDERLEEINAELDQFADTLRSGGSKQEPLRVTRRWASVLRSLVPQGMPTSGNVLHSLKVTLAASICYILANAIDWPGILTCVVTVLVTGLTSTGPMKMKQAHRFIGSLIGGGIGVGVLSLLYPNMDSVTALICVVAPLAFVAGWITRSPNIGYIGYQIALSFFLTALPGMSASTDLTPAGNRLVGIILGFAVMWFVFDQMWPVRTTDALTESLRRIRDACDEVKKIALSPERPGSMDGFEGLRSTVSAEVFNVRQLEISVKYETGRHRMQELFGVKRLVREIESAAADFYTTALQISRNRTS
jgi:multidrug resistance protein MdtO